MLTFASPLVRGGPRHFRCFPGRSVANDSSRVTARSSANRPSCRGHLRARKPGVTDPGAPLEKFRAFGRGKELHALRSAGFIRRASSPAVSSCRQVASRPGRQPSISARWRHRAGRCEPPWRARRIGRWSARTGPSGAADGQADHRQAELAASTCGASASTLAPVTLLIALTPLSKLSSRRAVSDRPPRWPSACP